MVSSQNSLTSNTTNIDISWGAIIGIVIGAILCIALGYLLYYFCTMYCFYISDEKSRPQFLFTHSAEERDCGTIACININRQLIICCCPSLKQKIEKANTYQKVDTSVNITPTGSYFVPVYQNNLNNDEESQSCTHPRLLSCSY